VGTLSKLLHPRDNKLPPSAIVACTERNQETLNRFLDELGNVSGIPFQSPSQVVTISISFLIFLFFTNFIQLFIISRTGTWSTLRRFSPANGIIQLEFMKYSPSNAEKCFLVCRSTVGQEVSHQGRYTHRQKEKHDHKVDNCESNGPLVFLQKKKEKICVIFKALLPRKEEVVVSDGRKYRSYRADGIRTDELMR
jgi:hypothetical protein